MWGRAGKGLTAGAHVVRTTRAGLVPTSGVLRRPCAAIACRPAGAGADQIRNSHQPQNREHARLLTVPLTLLGRADKVIE
jgi:hypothetical protein